MEDKNELSDIILEEKEDNKMMKVKRILIIAALLILIFLVTIVVVKMIKGDETGTQTAQQEGPALVLPPEPKAQEPEKEEDNLFKQVPIIEEEDKKESFEQMVKSLKEKEIKKQTQEPKKEEAVQETAAAEQKPQEAEKVVQEPKKAEPVATPKQAETQKQTNPATASTGYYIQVGATSRLSPDKKYLDSITKQNFSYALLPITVNDTKVTKILIGPYASSTEAKNVLPDVKKSINKDAFIYRVR